MIVLHLSEGIDQIDSDTNILKNISYGSWCE